MDIPWYAILISIVVAGGLSFIIYKEDFKKSKLWKFALFLRFIGSFLLILLLFSPVISYQEHITVKPKLLIYRDESLSCDSSSQKVKTIIDSLLKRKYTDKVEIKSFKFAKEVYNENLPSVLSSRFVSRIDEVTSHLLQQTKDESVAAAILISDGIFNQGKLPGFIQGSNKLPVLTVGIGDSSQYPDLSIQTLIGNEFVYKQNKFVLESSLKSIKISNNPVSVIVKENGRIVHQENWIPQKQNDWVKMNFDIAPSQLGWVRYSVEIKSAIQEMNYTNNSKSIWVQVVDEKKKIHLVFSKPHPDIKAIKVALESKVQNDLQVYSGLNGVRNGGDVYVFHGFPSTKKELEVIKGCIQKQIPFWVFIDNNQGFGALELALNQTLNLNFVQFQEVTASFSLNFGAFSLEQDDRKWKSFGAINSPLMKLNLPSNFQAQLIQKWNGIATDFPLMGIVEMGQQRSAWFFGTGIWRWRMNEQRVHQDASTFDDWVSKNILWLAASGQKQKELKLSIQNRELFLGESYPILLTHYDQAGLPTTNGKVKLYLIDSSMKKRELSLVKSMGYYKTNFLASVNGQLKLRAELADKPETFDEVLVNVSKTNIETSNRVANFANLRILASKFSGSFYGENELDKLLKQLDSNSLNSERMIIQNVNLTFMQIFKVLLLIVVFFSGEWFLRKWLGKI